MLVNSWTGRYWIKLRKARLHPSGDATWFTDASSCFFMYITSNVVQQLIWNWFASFELKNHYCSITASLVHSRLFSALAGSDKPLHTFKIEILLAEIFHNYSISEINIELLISPVQIPPKAPKTFPSQTDLPKLNILDSTFPSHRKGIHWCTCKIHNIHICPILETGKIMNLKAEWAWLETWLCMKSRGILNYSTFMIGCLKVHSFFQSRPFLYRLILSCSG